MRTVVFSCLMIGAMTSNGAAQERSQRLPEIVIGGETKGGGTTIGGTGGGGTHAAAAAERCVEVEIGASKSMDCLNQQLKREVDRVNPTVNQPPIDARSPDTKVGVVNIPGVQQQYGRNFGLSVVPDRPPPPIYAPSLGGRR
jgi:hypothetical protein